MSSKPFQLFDVHIQRGKDVVTVEVPEHEIRVLQAVHGPERVFNKGPIKDATEDFNTDLGFELDRLRRKYRQVGKKDPVDLAYPNGFGLDGFKVSPVAAAKTPQSQVKDHRRGGNKDKPAKDDKDEKDKGAKPPAGGNQASGQDGEKK